MSSLVLIKPDAIEHRLLGWCVAACEIFGIDDLKMVTMTPSLCAAHYRDHIGKDFYLGLQEFMCSAPLCAVAVRGDVLWIRDTAKQIRRQWSQYVNGPRNLIHSSDSESAAGRELRLWFPSSATTGTTSASASI